MQQVRARIYYRQGGSNISAEITGPPFECVQIMLLINFVGGQARSIYVTRPAKIGHVGTNYTPPRNISYLSIGMEYFYSVTCMLKPAKVLIHTENFMAKQ